jgi:hypothetical protein
MTGVKLLLASIFFTGGTYSVGTIMAQIGSPLINDAHLHVDPASTFLPVSVVCTGIVAVFWLGRKVQRVIDDIDLVKHDVADLRAHCPSCNLNKTTA